jgi:hypothetical protein
MIAKVSVKTAIRVCGRGIRSTRARDILKAFSALGVEIKGRRLIPVQSSRMPRRCLQLVAFVHCNGAYKGKGKTLRHWRILWDGHIYDPEYGISFLEGGKPSEAWWSRVVSVIEL